MLAQLNMKGNQPRRRATPGFEAVLFTSPYAMEDTDYRNAELRKLRGDTDPAYDSYIQDELDRQRSLPSGGPNDDTNNGYDDVNGDFEGTDNAEYDPRNSVDSPNGTYPQQNSHSPRQQRQPLPPPPRAPAGHYPQPYSQHSHGSGYYPSPVEEGEEEPDGYGEEAHQRGAWAGAPEDKRVGGEGRRPHATGGDDDREKRKTRTKGSGGRQKQKSNSFQKRTTHTWVSTNTTTTVMLPSATVRVVPATNNFFAVLSPQYTPTSENNHSSNNGHGYRPSAIAAGGNRTPAFQTMPLQLPMPPSTSASPSFTPATQHQSQQPQQPREVPYSHISEMVVLDDEDPASTSVQPSSSLNNSHAPRLPAIEVAPNRYDVGSYASMNPTLYASLNEVGRAAGAGGGGSGSRHTSSAVAADMWEER